MSARFGARARVLAGMSCWMVASAALAQQSQLQPKAAEPPQPAAAQPAQPAQPAAPGSLPWAAASAPPNAAAPPPGFLDTTDKRIRDERPTPTKEDVAALGELDTEVQRFMKIGGS